MRLKNYTPLALMAADQEDIEVVSAILQDAIGKVGDMAYLSEERRFVMVMNRFIWEDGIKRRFGPYARVRTGIHFDDVSSVRTKSLRLDAKDAVVEVLQVTYAPESEEDPDAGGTLSFTLSGGGAIALTVDAINASLRDISAPWRTPHKPQHRE